MDPYTPAGTKHFEVILTSDGGYDVVHRPNGNAVSTDITHDEDAQTEAERFEEAIYGGE